MGSFIVWWRMPSFFVTGMWVRRRRVEVLGWLSSVIGKIKLKISIGRRLATGSGKL
jgi:hypothetical protein